MGTNNIVFLEVLEWFDKTGREIVQRLPAEGSAEIKFGAQMIVRENQAGIFFYNGKALHVFGPGRHTLKTANIPVLNKMLALPWGFQPLAGRSLFHQYENFPGFEMGDPGPCGL
jgi:membrane protease subunit (stomatin/prohibitin family)